jgi:ArsR family transcriptional regulator
MTARKVSAKKVDIHRITRALADPRRFEIFEAIATCGETACVDLKERFPVTPATLSHHLKALADAQLVTVRRHSKFMHLKLRREVWKAYLAQLNRL